MALLLALVLAGAVVAARRAPTTAAASCGPRFAPKTYIRSVQRAVAAGTDLWGSRLLASRNGPTLSAAQRFLTPLLLATQRGQRPLTPSGFYYVPLSFGFSSNGPAVFALHVADGSEIITRHVGGPSLSFYVGDGRERYGSCTARLHPARLAEGYLPIVQTSYVDAKGVKYTQESFAGRVYGARSVVSFVQLHIDARRARSSATVRLVPWKLLSHTAPDRLSSGDNTRLIVSDGAEFAHGVVSYHVSPGDDTTVYAEWLNGPSEATPLTADPESYVDARATVVSYWSSRLTSGMRFSVPEPAVGGAALGVLEQVLQFGWRYSVGNQYEELSFAEALDSAEVAAEYGFPSVAKVILQVSLQRLNGKTQRFSAFRAGHLLSTAALYYRLTGDRAFVRRETPGLARLVLRIHARQVRHGTARGRLRPERLSSDVHHDVDSVNGAIAAWQGLLAMDRVWGVTGHRGIAARARFLALGIASGLRSGLRKSSRRLSDGSLFVPDALNAPNAGPYARLTKVREGSYWNLLMPYALASGFFPAHSREAHGLVDYVLAHGSRLLGVPRSDAHIIYSNEPYGSGLGEGYGLNMSRFMADNDHPDQLDLSLYGMLAIGMTRGTYISGEAISVVPVNGVYYRSMYMPPNSAANASYLETFRQTLIHERRGATGAPVGLDLAFSTPRTWLSSGKTISVEEAPTSFGPVSFSIARAGSRIDVHVTAPPRAQLRLRLRLPEGERIRSVSLGTLNPVSGTVDLGTRPGETELSAGVTR